jgi:hypothetical protein
MGVWEWKSAREEECVGVQVCEGKSEGVWWRAVGVGGEKELPRISHQPGANAHPGVILSGVKRSEESFRGVCSDDTVSVGDEANSFGRFFAPLTLRSE